MVWVVLYILKCFLFFPFLSSLFEHFYPTTVYYFELGDVSVLGCVVAKLSRIGLNYSSG